MIQNEDKPTRLRCSEIWGGIGNTDLDVSTRPVTTSLFSSASDSDSGGDVYYFSVCARDTIVRIAMADVMGHGRAVSTMSQWMYTALVERMDSIHSNDILGDLNRLANERGHEAITTAVVFSFRVENAELYLSYAGHPPVWIRRHKEGVWLPLAQRQQTEPINLPLGMFPDTKYSQQQLRLDSGDRLLAFTDGLIDAPSRNGQPFGHDGLQAALEEAGGGTLFHLKQGVLAAVRSHTGGSLGHDDVTLIAVDVH